MTQNSILWEATDDARSKAHITNFRNWLQQRGVATGNDYEDLWQWSVENTDLFWSLIWEYFDVGEPIEMAAVVQGEMPNTEWFAGTSVNLVEKMFQSADPDVPALIFKSERMAETEISWKELKSTTSKLQGLLQDCGIRPGERVGAVIPNIPEATYAFMATCALGAVWSSCSPDFGPDSIIDRLSQIKPKVIVAVDGYQYGGKPFDRTDMLRRIVTEIPEIEHIILIPYLNSDCVFDDERTIYWNQVLEAPEREMTFEQVPFGHPLWVLYSSGTTGIPKAITHSHGGILLEHFKYLAFHNDVRHGEKFFWFSTTGWMMWNYIHGALLHGASVVLYDGSPAYPDLGVLWNMASNIGLEHFGASAPFYVACMREGLKPGDDFDLSSLRTVSSTGAPLPAEAFDWVYQSVGSDVWLCSMSGGTDVCTAFVGGCIEKPVRRSEIQCRALGVSLHAFDEDGKPVIDSLGEMVITKPMPSMPVFFWNDTGKKRYKSSYFEKYPGIWRHGDWVKLTKEGGLVIYGRSDATLNRQGVRIGTAEIYRVLNTVPEIKDALIVHLDQHGQDLMPLFIVLQEGSLNEDLMKQIKVAIRTKCSPRHVPDLIIQISEVPYTMSGKKMEAPVKKILSGSDPSKVLNKDAMRNPEAMQFFIDLGSGGALDS